MKRLRLARGVKAEIKASARWYDEQAGLGAEFREAVESVLDDVSRTPGSHAQLTSVKSVVVRQAFMTRFRFKIMYRRRTTRCSCSHALT